MLIRQTISSYKHFDLGNIKLAFTQVCEEELFKDVYFAANSLYYVESGSAILYADQEKIHIKKGEIAIIKQHSKLDIQKSKDDNGIDFKSIIFYLFPDFVSDFARENSPHEQSNALSPALLHLGSPQSLKDFSESLIPLFECKEQKSSDLKEITFTALQHLSQHNEQLIHFLFANNKPVKIDLYEFMIHTELNNYSVKDLSQLTGRSLSAFKRDFFTIFETTPHQWLLSRKINYAEQLLRDQKMKPNDIYFMLGFNELSHFSAAFKKIKGLSPSQI